MNNSKIIVITGASSGIGKATALYLLEKEHKVYGLARRVGKMSDIIKKGGIAKEMDVTNNPTSKYFDNMRNRPIKGSTDWTMYEIILDVPENSYSMNFGILLAGS